MAQCHRPLFAKLTGRGRKDGIFHSVVDLQAAINLFIKENNEAPRPFIWKVDLDEIMHGHQMSDSTHWPRQLALFASPFW